MIVKETILKKVLARLKAELNGVEQPDSSIKIMVDGRATPSAGDEFISVHGGPTVNLLPPKEITKRIEFGLRIGITRRMLGTWNETAGEVILTDEAYERAKPSMLARALEVANLIDGSWTLFGEINTELETSDGGCFISPLGFVSMDDEPTKVDEEHWDLTKIPGQKGLKYAGLLLELYFGGAVYVKNIGPKDAN